MKKLTILTLALAITFSAASSHAAIYVKYEGIDGSAKSMVLDIRNQLDEWMGLLVPAIQKLQIQLDSTTEHIKKAVLHVRKQGGEAG